MQEMWVQSLDQEDLLKEDMATHSSILAWKIPWTEEPSGLQSMELQRVRHDLVTYIYTPGCTPVFFPGKSYGQRSLVGYSPWGHTESDMTEAT